MLRGNVAARQVVDLKTTVRPRDHRIPILGPFPVRPVAMVLRQGQRQRAVHDNAIGVRFVTDKRPQWFGRSMPGLQFAEKHVIYLSKIDLAKT